MWEILVILAVVVLAAGWLARRRIRRATQRRRLTDDMVRRIEESGTLRWEEREPLDLDEIREEEDAFWEQTWDEPEEL